MHPEIKKARAATRTKNLISEIHYTGYYTKEKGLRNEKNSINFVCTIICISWLW